MRCSLCDATHDGNLTDIPFKRSRMFDAHPQKPWLLVCSDCGPYGLAIGQENMEEGEVPNLETGWETE